MDAYMLEKIYDVFLIPIYVIKDGEESISFPSKEIYQSPFERDQSLSNDILARAKSRPEPYLYLENENIYYGAFRDKEGYFYLFGPMARKLMSGSDVEAYRHAHRIQLRFLIEKCGFGIASKMLALAYYHYTGIRIANQDILIESKADNMYHWNPDVSMEKYQLEQSEAERVHNCLEYENHLLDIVRSGDVAAMKELLNEDRLDMDDIGVVAVDKLKQTEYLMVSFIALISRAAIQGGLNPERAYEMSDIYLQQLEKSRNAAEMEMVGLKAQFDVTEQVYEAKKQRSKLIYIEECKDYIAKHLRKPFKVGDIAPTIGVNRSYLAKRFSEVEGMTIQQYIMQERCKHAANLLKYSKCPISIISEYFCFSSQSHFGVQFKKIYGMTPNEYRNQYRYIESFDNE